MCGIAGTLSDNSHLVSTMIDRIRHRGPDGHGLAIHQDVTLGMVRLAIVDVEHGHQPMANDDESIIIVFNGEIYNAPELRKELQHQGVQFKTRSDTEVILRLYEQDPERVEQHLIGMWAFAIHDRRHRALILSRDRFGIKPLFIANNGTFASELRCFDRREIDHDSAHAMVSWSYVPENRTIYKNISRVPPATRITINLEDHRRTTRVYWELKPSQEASYIQSMDEACVFTSLLLQRAVKEHLESDVPVASFLSGGIDSSLITAYAKVKAFNIGFTEKQFDESPFAIETAAKIGVPISVEMLDETKALSHLHDAMAAYDEPFGDSSSLATYILSKHVSQHFKVALSGDGGDEVFAGYKKYAVTKLRKPFKYIPWIRDTLGSIVPHSLVRTVLKGTDSQVYARLSPWLSLAETSKLMRHPVSNGLLEEEIQARFSRASGTELQKTLAADLGSMLPNDMLTKVDRASMACSLEVRVPFLDHRIVEFGVGLPQRFALGKRVLKTLHEHHFGPELAHRKKQGFSIPVKKWLSNPVHHQLFDKSRLDKHGILSSDELSNGGFQQLVSTQPLIAWHVFALATWLEQ